MKSIGIRVSPKVIYYTIFDNQKNQYYCDKLLVPLSLSTPNKLRYIRTNLQSIILESKIIYAGIRLTESTSQNIDIFRINIEGVIQELFSNSSIEKYFIGNISSIGKYLNLPPKEVKKLIDNNEQFSKHFHIENKLLKEEKECYIVATAAVKCKEDDNV